jgi:hypothetical protein
MKGRFWGLRGVRWVGGINDRRCGKIYDELASPFVIAGKEKLRGCFSIF